MTSAGSSLKFCLVATGEADLYPRLGRTMEWDTAAGHAVLPARAGAWCASTIIPPLPYGKPGFANPFFIAHAPGVDAEGRMRQHDVAPAPRFCAHRQRGVVSRDRPQALDLCLSGRGAARLSCLRDRGGRLPPRRGAGRVPPGCGPCQARALRRAQHLGRAQSWRGTGRGRDRRLHRRRRRARTDLAAPPRRRRSPIPRWRSPGATCAGATESASSGGRTASTLAAWRSDLGMTGDAPRSYCARRRAARSRPRAPTWPCAATCWRKWAASTRPSASISTKPT